MPPLLADLIHSGACKPICEKYLILPKYVDICMVSLNKTLSYAILLYSFREFIWNKIVCHIWVSLIDAHCRKQFIKPCV